MVRFVTPVVVKYQYASGHPCVRPRRLRRPRRVVALSLTACNTSSTTCTNNVTLGGKGSSILVKTNQVRSAHGSFTVVFEGASAGTATLNIQGQSGACTQGQSIVLAQLSITCASVKDAEVKFTITGA